MGAMPAKFPAIVFKNYRLLFLAVERGRGTAGIYPVDGSARRLATRRTSTPVASRKARSMASRAVKLAIGGHFSEKK